MALVFAARCHAPQQRTSDGARFIEHPLEVAGLLQEAGCSDILVAAGLLHDIVENTPITVTELTACFGKDVARLVHAVSDDPSIHSYRLRKRMLRDQVRNADSRDAALLFAADKISKVRELPNLVRRDRERFDAKTHESNVPDLPEHDHQMRLEHYHESLRMLQTIAPEHPLVKQLANELDNCRWCLAPRDSQRSLTPRVPVQQP